jgi:hypothetical protein
VITLYPNPAKNTLFIDGNGEKVSGKLLVVDGSGRVVLEKDINPSNKVKVDISKLPVGLLMYRLGNLKGTFIKR